MLTAFFNIKFTSNLIKAFFNLQLIYYSQCLNSLIKIKIEKSRLHCINIIAYHCIFIIKDEIYLNLVLEFIPETVYKVARQYSKQKQVCVRLFSEIYRCHLLYLLLNLKRFSQVCILLYPITRRNGKSSQDHIFGDFITSPPLTKKNKQIYVLNFGRSSIKKMYRANLFFRKKVSNKKGKVKSVIFTVFSLGI